MRAFQGQHSDRVTIKRTPEQKASQLRQLKEQLAALKSHAADSLRASLTRRVAELEAELASSPAKRPPRSSL